MNAETTIASAIATSTSEDRTVDVRIEVAELGQFEWVAECPDDCNFSKISDADAAEGEVVYDVWGTTEDGSTYRLSLVEWVAAD